jgi:hypothetical protein
MDKIVVQKLDGTRIEFDDVVGYKYDFDELVITQLIGETRMSRDKHKIVAIEKDFLSETGPSVRPINS